MMDAHLSCSSSYFPTNCYTCSVKHTPRKTLPAHSISSDPKYINRFCSPDINFCITALFCTYAPNVRFNAGRMTRCIASSLAGIAPAERLCVGEPMMGGRGFKVFRDEVVSEGVRESMLEQGRFISFDVHFGYHLGLLFRPRGQN